ncbi:MAG: hypothetical protein LBL74_00675 [Bacteroidales bacterium]|nr:hypothetical protein [Bacteroidales bacterium]
MKGCFILTKQRFIFTKQPFILTEPTHRISMSVRMAILFCFAAAIRGLKFLK